jgi:hypothetical protein
VAALCKQLRECRTSAQVTEALTRVPSKLQTVYTQALQRIRRSDRRFAREIILLLLCVRSPLRILGVLDYAKLETQDHLREICTTPLFRLNASQISLYCPSVRSFLLNERDDCPELKDMFTFSEREAHEHVASACLDQLGLRTPSSFTEYARSQLLHHWRESCEYPACPMAYHSSVLLSRFANSFGLLDGPASLEWLSASEERRLDCPTPLHAALSHGCIRLASHLVKFNPAKFDQKGRLGTPLHMACKLGYSHLVHQLLVLGADSTLESGPAGTALCAACDSKSDEGRASIVHHLLESTPKAALEAIYDSKYGSALHIASSYGNLGVVTMLLEAGANPNTPGGIFGNALQDACAYGHLDVAELLRKYGACEGRPCGILGSASRAARLSGIPKMLEFARSMEQNAQIQNSRGLLWKEAIRRAMPGSRIRRAGGLWSTRWDLSALLAPLRAVGEELFPLPGFVQSLSSAQMAAYLVHQFTTPSVHLKSSSHNPTYV